MSIPISAAKEKRRRHNEAKDAPSKELRRLDVWKLYLSGLSYEDISLKLGITTLTVRSDVSKSFAIAKERMSSKTVDYLIKYIAEQDNIIYLCLQRLERMNEIEDRWMARAFDATEGVDMDDYGDEGDDSDEPEINPLTGRPVFKKKQRKSRKSAPFVPLQPKGEHAAIISEIQKASTAKAKALGLLREKVDITIDLYDDSQLLARARERGIDLVALGIEQPVQTKAEVIKIEQKIETPEDDFIFGDYSEIKEIPSIPTNDG